MSSKLKDKVRGALYASAIGDAMGATTEFMTSDMIKEKYGVLNELVGGGWLRLKPGQVTDDTQMAICIMQAVVVGGSISFDDDFLCRVADNFIRWYNAGPPDVGGACSKRISQMDAYPKQRDHVTHKTISTMLKMRNESALGNGALMRAVPLAVLGRDGFNVKQGKLTHNNQTCSRLLKSYSKALYVAMLTDKLPQRPAELMRPSGHVKNTYNNALWHANSGVKRGLIGAVNDGGDADTIAAVTGGLAGAAFGLSSVPERWIEQLDSQVCSVIESFSNCACKFLKGVL